MSSAQPEVLSNEAPSQLRTLQTAHPAVDPGALTVRQSGGRGADSTMCCVRVPRDSMMVSRTRRAMVEDLRARDVPEPWVRDAEIVLSELLTNAMRHARPLSDGTVRVRWKISPESVEVEVTDGGSGTVPTPRPQAAWQTAGRGLRVVRTVAHEWGATQDRTGHVVWATLGGPSRRRVG